MESSSKWADFGKRFVTGVIGAIVVIGSIVIGSPFYLVLVLFAIFATAYELQHIIYPSQRPYLPLAVMFIIILATLSGYPAVSFGVLGIGILAGDYWIKNRTPLDNPWRPAYTPLMVTSTLVGIALSSLYLIREGQDGLAWILFLLASNWGTDIFALIGGRLWGKRKLAPKISAGKTVEGAIAGVVMGTVGGVSVALVAGLPIWAFVLAFCITFVTILGDLSESKLKRFYNVKDSGSILPGHGGVLDRIDGLIPSSIFLFIILRVLL